MKNRTNNKSQHRLSFATGFGLVLLAASLVFGSVSLAKYLSRENNDQLYIAQNFYFTSDYLQPKQSNGEYILHTLQEGVSTIEFQLRNYADNLRSSDTDIHYVVYLDGVAQEAGTLAKNDADGAITISLTGVTSGEHIITVQSTAPYAHTIGARFKVTKATNTIEYEARGSANHPMMQLTVRTNNYSGWVRITWGEGVIPDKTDPLLTNAVATDRAIHVKLDSNSEYTFTFLKSDLTQDLSNTLAAIIVAGS